MGELSRSMT